MYSIPDKRPILEDRSDLELSSTNTDLGDTSRFVGRGEILTLDEIFNKRLLDIAVSQEILI
jgi:hypothetical protein